MLIKHKNFHFTQIPDKTNVIFLKKTKNHVFGQFLMIFGHFYLMGIFFEKMALSQITRYGRLTPC